MERVISPEYAQNSFHGYKNVVIVESDDLDSLINIAEKIKHLPCIKKFTKKGFINRFILDQIMSGLDSKKEVDEQSRDAWQNLLNE